MEKSVDSEVQSALPVLHTIRMPRIRIGLPADFSMPSFFNSDSDMDSMFTQMRNRMNEMMNNMMQGIQGSAGTGQVTVIRSGPGYHQERTYNFGPVKQQENEAVKEMVNDMGKFMHNLVQQYIVQNCNSGIISEI